MATAECKVVHGHMCQFLNRTQHGMDTLKDGDKLYTALPDLSADWLRKHDAQVLRNATKEVEQMWSDNFGRDCESAYARVLHKLQSMAAELEGEMKRNEIIPRFP